MKFFYPPLEAEHDAGQISIASISRPSRDRPERGRLLREAALELGLEEVVAPVLGTEILCQVHSTRYVGFLSNLWRDWMREVAPVHGAPEAGIVANTFPTMRMPATYPRSVLGRVGFHFHDQVAPVREETFRIAMASASAAFMAADDVLDGAGSSYALCRPSGHHAGFENCGGSTYFNNAAVAAQRLLSKFERVAIVDIDVHHGNGTQDIFYERDDVFFLSLHRDPQDYVPYYWGYTSEAGAAAGTGYNLNVPLAGSTDDDAYLCALESALIRVQQYDARALVVSMGFDALAADPCGGMQLSEKGYGEIGGMFSRLGLPTILVQEGGYAIGCQGQCLKAFIGGFAARTLGQ